MHKLTATTYLGIGLLLGYILFSLMGKTNPITLGSITLMIGYLVALGLWQWSEGKLHRHHERRWGEIRDQGKHLFVLVRFVFLRGLILVVLFVGPMLSSIDVSWAFAVGVLILIVTISRGYQEWSDCEAFYQASLHRDTAESLRALQN